MQSMIKPITIVMILAAVIVLPLHAANRVGDADNSGTVEMVDAGLALARHLNLVDQWAISPLALADADSDVDLDDARLIGQAANGYRTIAGPGDWLQFSTPSNMSTQSGMPSFDVIWGVFSAYAGTAEQTDGLSTTIEKIPVEMESTISDAAPSVSGFGAITEFAPVNTSGTEELHSLRLRIEIQDSAGTPLIEYLEPVSILVGPSVCGNGTPEPGEYCDFDDPPFGEGACVDNCTIIQTCGDGVVSGIEACDDGNTVDDCTCPGNCQFSPGCGDGLVCGAEQCDDGDTVDNCNCLGDCTLPFCGDGLECGIETCDDGNTSGGDGCTATCEFETGFCRPELVGRIGGQFRDIVVAGNYAYIAQGTGGIAIYDVANPSAPLLVSRLDTAGSARAVDLEGSTLYVADQSRGLIVMDVSNPAAPAAIGHYSLPGQAVGVLIDGTLAYVALETLGFAVVDVSLPASPALLTQVSTPQSVHRIRIDNGLLYTANNSRLEIFDASNPAAPQYLSTKAITSSPQGFGFATSGFLLYVVEDNRIKILDTSNPLSSVWLDTITESNALTFLSVTRSGNRLYASTRYNGLRVYDISTPDVLVHLDTFPIAIFDVETVALEGSTAFLISRFRGLQTVDISEPPPFTELGWLRTVGDPWSMVLDGNTLLIADGRNGMLTLDVTTPTTPSILGHYRVISGDARDLTIDGSTAYMTSTWDRIVALDISNPAEPLWIDFVELDPSNEDTTPLVIANDSTSNTLLVLDDLGRFMSTPYPTFSPDLFDTAPDAFYDMEFYNGDALVTDDNGLALIDYSSAPIYEIYFTDTYSINDAQAVTTHLGYAFVANSTGTVTMIDLQAPLIDSIILGLSTAPDRVSTMEVSGNSLLAVGDFMGFATFNIATPTDISPPLYFPTGSTYRDVAVIGNTLYLVDAGGGIDIVSNLPGSCTSTCGNAIMEYGESCDDGIDNGTCGFCNSTCDGIVGAVCGDGVAECGEACDDGNTLLKDGCTPDCVIDCYAWAWETGDEDWTHAASGGTAPDLWHHTTLDAYGGTNSWYMGREPELDYDAGHVVNALTSPPLAIQPGDSLSLWEKYEFEPSENYDDAQILVLDADTLSVLGTLRDRSPEFTTNGAWVEATHSLDTWAGQSIRVQFLFDSVDTVNNDYFGWMIDHLIVGTCVSPPVCGNGLIETGETCDDGNTTWGDGCNSLCTGP